MARLVKGTIRRAFLVGIVLTISGLAGSVSGQANLAGPSAQVFKTDSDSSSRFSNLIAANNGNLGGTVTMNLPVGDKVGTTTNGSTNTSEIPTNVTVEASRPNVALLNSVMPSGVQPSGTDLVFTVTFTNSGGQAAQDFTVVDPIPAETDFKLDSATTVLGTTGMSVVMEFSNDNAATWTYAPVSGGGGALDGYDRLVTHVRWRFNGSLSQTFPDNGGSVAVTARIQ